MRFRAKGPGNWIAWADGPGLRFSMYFRARQADFSRISLSWIFRLNSRPRASRAIATHFGPTRSTCTGRCDVDVTGAGYALLFGKVKRIHGRCLMRTLLALLNQELVTDATTRHAVE
jgi:hypothetical protein